MWVVLAGVAAAQVAEFPADQFGRPDKTARQKTGAAIDLEALMGDKALYEPVFKLGVDDLWATVGRSVGMLDLKVRQKNGVETDEVCTATLIAADRILTNYHCDPGVDGGQVIQSWLYLGYLDRAPDASGQRFAVTVTPIDEDHELDYAVLKVTGVPTDRYPPLPLRAGTPKDGQSLYMLHHPLGFPQRLTRLGCKAATPALNPTTGEFVHVCDTQPGSSGALLLDQSQAVIALHHGGVEDRSGNYNLATPIGKLLADSAELRRIAARPPTPLPGPAGDQISGPVTRAPSRSRRLLTGFLVGAAGAAMFGTTFATSSAYDHNPSRGLALVNDGLFVGSVGFGVTSVALLARGAFTPRARSDTGFAQQGAELRDRAERRVGLAAPYGPGDCVQRVDREVPLELCVGRLEPLTLDFELELEQVGFHPAGPPLARELGPVERATKTTGRSG